MGLTCSCDGCHEVLQNADALGTEELQPMHSFWGTVDPPKGVSSPPFAISLSSPSSPCSPEWTTELELDPGKDEFLGCCSIGAVMKTRDRASNSILAMKQICKKNMEGTAWLDEVEALKKLNHPHICKLHGSWEDRQSVYLIMDLCRGGNIMELSDNHDQFNESSIAVLVHQMGSAVSHLHKHNLVHSDIRPENWLFGEPVEARSSALEMCLKMIDFGLASKHGKVGRRSRQEMCPNPPSHGFLQQRSFPRACGIPGKSAAAANRLHMGVQDIRALFCRAPEQLSAPRGQPDAKSDIWALGVIAFFMLSGQSPFNVGGSVAPEEDLSLRNARFVFMPAEIWRPISSEAKHFIAMCLQRDPASRPPAEKLLDLPWMRLARAALEPGSAETLGPEGLPTTGSSRRPSLSVHDPPLPSAPEVRGALARIRRAQLAERAAAIAAARCLPAGCLGSLRAALEAMDPAGLGVLPMRDVLRALAACGVPPDLAGLAGDLPPEAAAAAVLYADFLLDVLEFQQNMQDIALWAVFRGFDVDGRGAVPKQDLVRVLGLQECRQSLLTSFPKLSLDKILAELGSDSSGVIDFEDFKQCLTNPGVPEEVEEEAQA